jgi:hypothetical protein
MDRVRSFRGPAQAWIFVAGADQCDVDFDAPGDKPAMVKVFVQNRGLGGKCERLKDRCRDDRSDLAP